MNWYQYILKTSDADPIPGVKYYDIGHSLTSTTPSANNILWFIGHNNALHQISELKLYENIKERYGQDITKVNSLDLEPIHANWGMFTGNRVKASGRVNYDHNNASVMLDSSIDPMSQRYSGTAKSVIKKIMYEFRIPEDRIYLFN